MVKVINIISNDRGINDLSMRKTIELKLEFEDYQILFLEIMSRQPNEHFDDDIISEAADTLKIDRFNYNDKMREGFDDIFSQGFIERVTGKNEHYFKITNVGKLVLFASRK